MSTHPAARLLSGTSLIALLVLGACTGEANGPSGSVLSQSEANELAEIVAEDADQFSDASTYEIDTGMRLQVGSLSSPGGPRLSSPPDIPCRPIKSPENPANVDNDRVPDAVLFDFTGFDCTVGEVHVVMSGTLGIEDPAIPGFGVRFIFSNLSKSVTRGDATMSRSWNGTRQIVGSPSNPGTQLTHTITNFTTSFVFPNGNSAQHVKNWNGSFVADVAGSIQYGERMPSGTWSFDGNSTWTRNQTESRSIQISTTTPLHYNAACDVSPKFDAGVIVAQVTRNGETATVTIEHTACGQKIVTRS